MCGCVVFTLYAAHKSGVMPDSSARADNSEGSSDSRRHTYTQATLHLATRTQTPQISLQAIYFTPSERDK